MHMHLYIMVLSIQIVSFKFHQYHVTESYLAKLILTSPMLLNVAYH